MDDLDHLSHTFVDGRLNPYHRSMIRLRRQLLPYTRLVEYVFIPHFYFQQIDRNSPRLYTVATIPSNTILYPLLYLLPLSLPKWRLICSSATWAVLQLPVGTSNFANLMITALAEHFSMLLNDAIMYDSSVLHGVGHAKSN